MLMSNADIAKNYREAKNKREQIETLAIMNSLSERAVVSILLDNGIEPETLPKKYRTVMLDLMGPLPQREPEIVIPDCIVKTLQMRLLELKQSIGKQIKVFEKAKADLDKLLDEEEEMLSFLEKGGVDIRDATKTEDKGDI